MGMLLAFMFLWNMLGALILLPALAHFLLKPDRKAVQESVAVKMAGDAVRHSVGGYRS